MSAAFPKSARLVRRGQFRFVGRKGSRAAGKCIHVESCMTSSPNSKLGITASKKYGNAVQRNRFKRWVRECYRQLREHLPPGLFLVVHPKKSGSPCSFQEILEDLQDIFNIKT